MPVSASHCPSVSPVLGHRTLHPASSFCYAGPSTFSSPSPAPSRSPSPVPSTCSGGFQSPAPSFVSDVSSSSSRAGSLLPSYGVTKQLPRPRTPLVLARPPCAATSARPVTDSAKSQCSVMRQRCSTPRGIRVEQGRADSSKRPPLIMSRANSVRARIEDIEGRLIGKSNGVHVPDHTLRPIPQPAKSSASTAIAIGDVLLIKGGGRVAQIGTSSGFMGHVLVALGPAEALDARSDDAQQLFANCPSLYGACIWRVKTLESCRSRDGLHQAEMLLRVDPATGCIFLVGELVGDLTMTIIDEETVEIWQSPPTMRSHCCSLLCSEVLCEMRASEQNWSFTTAARALLNAAQVHSGRNNVDLCEELKDCWDVAPICTSTVITFWQRYLCRLATATNQSQSDLMLRYMPIKADRALPGELACAMRRCGWVLVEHWSED